MSAVAPQSAHRPTRPRTPAPRLRALLGALCAALALVLAAPQAAAADAAAGVIRGGQTLHSSAGERCAVAYNATDGTDYYGLMAGYCGTVGVQWYADAALTVPVGTTSAAEHPGSSWSVVRYTSPDFSYPSEITGNSQPVRITGAAQPALGQSVCRHSSTTGLMCGTVTGVNQTISLPEGTINGLFRAGLCVEPGDTGGPAYAGTSALGLLVTGSGNCTVGGQSYYQPVVPVLSRLGLSVGY